MKSDKSNCDKWYVIQIQVNKIVSLDEIGNILFDFFLFIIIMNKIKRMKWEFQSNETTNWNFIVAQIRHYNCYFLAYMTYCIILMRFILLYFKITNRKFDYWLYSIVPYWTFFIFKYLNGRNCKDKRNFQKLISILMTCMHLLISIYLQTPYAETAPNATMANDVPTNNGAVSSRYVPINQQFIVWMKKYCN